MYFVELTLLAIVPFFAQKSKIMANFGYFVARFALFGTLFTGQNNAVVRKNSQISGMATNRLLSTGAHGLSMKSTISTMSIVHPVWLNSAMSIVHVKQTDRARVRQKCETSKYGTLALPKYSPWCATNRILLLNTCFGQVYLGSLIKIWKLKRRCHKKDMLWQTTKKITKGCQHHHGHIHQQATMFICTMHMEFARREEFTYECECARISTNLENFVGKYLLLLKRREGPPTVVRPSNTFSLPDNHTTLYYR